MLEFSEVLRDACLEHQLLERQERDLQKYELEWKQANKRIKELTFEIERNLRMIEEIMQSPLKSFLFKMRLGNLQRKIVVLMDYLQIWTERQGRVVRYCSQLGIIRFRMHQLLDRTFGADCLNATHADKRRVMKSIALFYTGFEASLPKYSESRTLPRSTSNHSGISAATLQSDGGISDISGAAGAVSAESSGK